MKVDEEVDLSVLEQIEEVPHCEAKHHNPKVHRWAGDCTHTVVATFVGCGSELPICLNTAIGVEKLRNTSKYCQTCQRLISECWSVVPV